MELMKRVGLVVLIALVVISIVWVLIAGTTNDHTYTITVTDKERITKTTLNGKHASAESYYLVFGDSPSGESLVFKNTDVLFRGKFNSSTVQGALKEGATYTVTVIGWRIPWLSSYENIIAYEAVEK